MNDNLLNKYTTLVRYIKNNGKSYPKKHGNWYKLDLFKDYFLELDSWNGKTSFCKGSGEYNEWTGFNGISIDKNCIGYDYGEWKIYHPDTLDWLLFDVLEIKNIEKKYI